MTKVPSSPSKHYGDVIHCDIGFGPTMSHGGINYCILFVDKATRTNIIQPLKTLKSNSLLTAFQKFINQLGVTPKLIHTDFDPKLISGKVRAYLDEKNIKIQAAPPKRQDQNGLVERHWQTVVNMARNWMRGALLPSKYWWFALRRACEVKNILPTTHIPNILTTPIELVHHKKSDYRQLFPSSPRHT